MGKETQVHNIVQMLCPHAMAILSAVFRRHFGEGEKRRRHRLSGLFAFFEKEQNWSTIYVRNKFCELCAFVNLNSTQTQNRA